MTERRDALRRGIERLEKLKELEERLSSFGELQMAMGKELREVIEKEENLK